ncbi:MAG: PAS domain S-box protein, partial [Acidobacteriota bacterium]|nr:PAS domain S-box protein [Acidobacteriota bacterium]
MAYGIATLGTAVLLAARLWFWGLTGGNPALILFLFPVLLSAYLGGLGPGLVSTVCVGLAARYFLLSPLHSLSIQGGLHSVQWLGLLASGGMVSLLSEGFHRETVGHRETLDKLRASEGRLVAILGSAMDGIISVDERQVITFFNHAAEKMFKCSALEAMGQPLVRFIPERFRSAHLEQIRNFGQNHITRRTMGQLGQVFGLRSDGEEFPIEASISHSEVAGQMLYTAILRDVTESHRAEEALMAERHLLRMLMDNLPDAIYFKDRESRFTRPNKAQARLWGISDPCQIVGKSDFEIFTPEHAQKAYDDEQEIIRTGQPMVDKEEKETWTDGHVTWASTTKMPLRDAHGNITGTFGVSRDITERKRAEEALRESEQRYRKLFERNLAGVFVTTLDGRILDCNPAMANILGFSSPQEVLDRRVSDVYFSNNDRTKLLEKLMVEERLTNFEMRLKRNDGSPVWLIANLTLQPPTADGRRIIEGTLIDISKRKRAEAENTLLAVVVNSSDDAIFSTTREGLIATWNAGAEHMHGYAAEEIRGRHFSVLIPEDRRGEIAANQEKLHRGEALVHYEFEHMRKDGSRLQVSETLSPIKDSKGFVTGVSVIARDITRRHQAEKAVAESEERYRTLFENAPVGIYRTTPDGRVMAANPAMIRMLGYSSLEELAARDLNTNGFEPQYSRARFMERVEQQGEVAGLESEWRRRDGELLFVRENARAVRDESGKTLFYEGTVEDITQYKRTEAEHVRLVTAIEQSAEAVVITNTRGDIEYVNPAFTRITGYGREEALGQNPRVLKSGRQDPELYRQLWGTILNGQPWHGELINRRKDGSFYTEQMGITPIRGPHGEVTHFIATKQDVTERKTLEAQLHQAAKMEAVGRLAGGVAHDFNNLLTIINGYSQILQEKLRSDTEASGHLKEISLAGERAATLTRQLLAFSRRQVLTPQVLDLNAVVSNLDKMLQRLIGEDIKLHTHLDPTLGRVKADPG